MGEIQAKAERLRLKSWIEKDSQLSSNLSGELQNVIAAGPEVIEDLNILLRHAGYQRRTSGASRNLRYALKFPKDSCMYLNALKLGTTFPT